MSNKVQKLYSIQGAKWYDWFKPIWNWLTSKKAEKRLSRFLKENLNEDKEILELGCGTALNLEKIHKLNLPFKHYIGLDFSQDMLKIARSKFSQPNIQFKHQDLTKLDGFHGIFDVILCTWVLSHLPSPADVVNRAQAFLKPGGKMFLIFLGQPKWYINFWFAPLAKYLFRSKFVSSDEIKKFRNVKSIKYFSGHITTTIELGQ